jgi:hypothetical protein
MAIENFLHKGNGVILYQTINLVEQRVWVENDTVRLNHSQRALLPDSNVTAVGECINMALQEKLAEFAAVAKLTAPQVGSNEKVLRNIDYYNLDKVISVSYRVKFNRAIQLRAWVNRILKNYILRGYAINQRFEQLEYRITENEKKMNLVVKTALPPKEGVFYDGQIFDAYIFVADLVKAAKVKIILIDNWLDESVLLLLAKRGEGVKATIYTKDVTPEIQQDLVKHNAQYPEIFIEKKANIHDRFLLVDNDLYHIGASFKDLGKKLFAFSKMEMKANELLKNI